MEEHSFVDDGDADKKQKICCLIQLREIDRPYTGVVVPLSLVMLAERRFKTLVVPVASKPAPRTAAEQNPSLPHGH